MTLFRRGEEIAARATITWCDGVWLVPSQRDPARTYRVTLDPPPPACTCPDYAERRQPCKHVHAVRVVVEGRCGHDHAGATPPVAVPAGAPRWVSAGLLAETIRVWQPHYAGLLTAEDALEILLNVSRLCAGAPRRGGQYDARENR